MRTKVNTYLFLALLFAACPLFAADGAMRGMHHPMPAGGAWSAGNDAAFLSGMIAHHEGAIEMARPVLAETDDPMIRGWAEGIVSSQQREIDEMRRLLRETGTSDDGAAAAMRDEMQAMMSSRAADNPDVNFVKLMIPHHAGAIDMSLPVLTGTENPRIRRLAENIIVAQTHEIAMFRQWLEDRHVS